MKEKITSQEEGIDELLHKARRFEERQKEADRNANTLHELYKMGLIDSKGNPTGREEME